MPNKCRLRLHCRSSSLPRGHLRLLFLSCLGLCGLCVSEPALPPASRRGQWFTDQCLQRTPDCNRRQPKVGAQCAWRFTPARSSDPTSGRLGKQATEHSYSGPQLSCERSQLLALAIAQSILQVLMLSARSQVPESLRRAIPSL